MPDQISNILILDLSMGVGDFFSAWLQRCKASRQPLLYVGASPSANDVEWLKHVIQDDVSGKLMSGELTMRGFEKKPADPPADLLMNQPPGPQLNLCTIKGHALVVPEAVVSQWAMHASFGPAFQEKLNPL